MKTEYKYWFDISDRESSGQMVYKTSVSYYRRFALARYEHEVGGILNLQDPDGLDGRQEAGFGAEAPNIRM